MEYHRTPAESEASKEAGDALDKFRESISTIAYDIYLDMEDLQNKAKAPLDAQIFANGFKLGTRIMFEVFQ